MSAEAVSLAHVQGTLALDLSPTLDPPRRRAGQASGKDGEVVSIDVLLRRDLEAWAPRYVQAVVEIVSGDRPASQLVRWTSRRVHEELVRRAQVVARAGVHQAGHGRGRRPVVRAAVRSVHTSFLSPGIAEVSAHVRHGARSRAIAARFEHQGARWVCTALEFA